MSRTDKSINSLSYSKCGNGWIAYRKDDPLTGVYVYEPNPILAKGYWMAKSDGKKLLEAPLTSRAHAAHLGLIEKERRNGRP